MKILVTGSAGFIGFNLCGRLLEEGHEVIASYRSGPPAFLQDLLARHGEALSLSRGDLLDGLYLESLAGQGIEGIVNAAIVTSPPSPEKDYFINMTRTNLDSTVNLLDFAMKAQVGNYVYVSSSGVYGSIYRHGDVIGEDSDLDLRTTYSITKRTCELLTSKFGALTGAKAVSARISSPYGPYERVTLSRSVMGPIYGMAHKALAGEEAVVFGKELERDWTYVEDIVDGICRLLTADGGSLRHEVYNVSCSARYSVEAIASAVRKALPGFRCRFTEDLGEADVVLSPPVERGIMDIARLTADTGFAPRYSLEEGVGRYVAFLKNEPDLG